MKGSAVLAAMDVNLPENTPVSRKFNITGRIDNRILVLDVKIKQKNWCEKKLNA